MSHSDPRIPRFLARRVVRLHPPFSAGVIPPREDMRQGRGGYEPGMPVYTLPCTHTPWPTPCASGAEAEKSGVRNFCSDSSRVAGRTRASEEGRQGAGPDVRKAACWLAWTCAEHVAQGCSRVLAPVTKDPQAHGRQRPVRSRQRETPRETLLVESHPPKSCARVLTPGTSESGLAWKQGQGGIIC